MATTIYAEQRSLVTWKFLSVASSDFAEGGNLYRYPYPKLGAVPRTIINKVWDDVAGGWVTWGTAYPDPYGVEYPGPGAYGVDTSDHRVETPIYERRQL